MRAIVDDALEHLARGAAGRGVIDHRGVGRFLVAAQQIGAVDGAMDALAGERRQRVVPREPAAQTSARSSHSARRRPSVTRSSAEMNGLAAFVLDA